MCGCMWLLLALRVVRSRTFEVCVCVYMCMHLACIFVCIWRVKSYVFSVYNCIWRFPLVVRLEDRVVPYISSVCVCVCVVVVVCVCGCCWLEGSCVCVCVGVGVRVWLLAVRVV